MSFEVILDLIIPALKISTNHHATRFTGLGRSRGHARSVSFIFHACTQSRYAERRYNWENCEGMCQNQEADAIPGLNQILNWISEARVRLGCSRSHVDAWPDRLTVHLLSEDVWNGPQTRIPVPEPDSPCAPDPGSSTQAGCGMLFQQRRSCCVSRQQTAFVFFDEFNLSWWVNGGTRQDFRYVHGWCLRLRKHV